MTFYKSPVIVMVLETIIRFRKFFHNHFMGGLPSIQTRKGLVKILPEKSGERPDSDSGRPFVVTQANVVRNASIVIWALNQ